LIASLEVEPRPPGAKELRARPGIYRQRLPGWRVIYRVADENLSFVVLAMRRKMGPETYDDLP
jgi:mRNA-degrading endonuclease RelE of RelBE toxin-antitoxin system